MRAAPTRITLCTRQDLYPDVHGGAVKIVRTAEALSRRGVEVTVVTADRLRYHRYVDGRHEWLEYPPRLVAATRVPPRLLPWLRRAGVPDYWAGVRELLFRLGYPEDEHLLYQPLVDPDFWLRTAWVGWRHGSAWFQAEFPGFGAAAWVAARLLRRKCSIVQHNVEWKRLEDTTALDATTIRRLREIELQVCHLADEVIVCSDEDRSLMLADDFERHELTVIPHGVDVERYGLKAGAGIRQRYGLGDRPLLFFHGTLHYAPNADACRVLAEEILPRLRDAGRPVHMLVAGMNPPAWTHPDLVYAGCVDDLPTHVAAADLCVVPLMDGGGTRLKILEYLAGERPVVSTHKGAEGIAASDGALLRVPDGDWDGFVRGILRLLDDRALARGLAAGGRAFAEQHTWDAVAGAFLSLYADEGLRGTDFGARFAAAVRPTQAPSMLGAERLAADAAGRDKTLAKERHGNASALLAQEPRVVAWRDDEVVHELAEGDLIRHLPAEPRWQKPRTMILLLNKRCNLRCDFCDLWHYTDMMPFESAATVVQRAPAAGVKTLVITGGEPYVHPRIHELIELARNLGLGVNITTNGTLLRRDLRRVVESGVDSLSVSLDGMQGTHDRLRGVAGTYDEVIAALDVLRSTTRIQLNVYFVVTRENVGELAAVYDAVAARGIAFDFWPVNGYPHLYVTSEEDRRTYLAAVDHIARTEPAVAARADYYRYGLQYMAGRRDHYRCLGLLEQFGVNHEGKLVPCCVWDQKGLQVGSALDEPLDQLFYSERAQALREQIFREGCVDQCFNHSLYEFQQATGLDFVVQPAQAPRIDEQAVIKESGQARAEAARARRKAAAKARRAEGGAA